MKEMLTISINGREQNMKVALELLDKEYSLRLETPDKALLLAEVDRAITLQRRVLQNAEEGGSGASIISVSSEAIMNYLGKYYRLSSGKEQHLIECGVPTRKMIRRVREIDRQYS
jgi:hypothetical protein